MRQYPVDAAGHAQVGLGKVIAGVELQRCWNAALDEQRFHGALVEIAEHGDWAKTLAVYPRRERPNPPVTSWMLPQGGVRLDEQHLPDDWQNSETVGKELMW